MEQHPWHLARGGPGRGRSPGRLGPCRPGRLGLRRPGCGALLRLGRGGPLCRISRRAGAA
ncbi:hypothetical protein [Micromonospora zhanjiangensis]|uniref:Uncharacterized protein n=1 Tax=Micromonospora zhanjiangensis TaxID=1522057 RepID=A0ABV8KKM3_9ACTN